MPTYDYRCRDCGQTFSVDLTLMEHDRLQTLLVKHEKPAVETASLACPKCGGTELAQQFGAFYAKTSKKS